MSVWELLSKSVDVILISAIAVVMAILGRLARLFHEDARGERKLTVRVFLANLPDSIVCAIIALGITYTAANYFAVPLYAGVALGAALGHLGIEIVVKRLSSIADTFIKKAPKDVSRMIRKKLAAVPVEKGNWVSFGIICAWLGFVLWQPNYNCAAWFN